MEKTDDSNALKRYFSFKKDWLTGRVRCFDVSGKELAAQFNFHERAWKEYLNECLEAESLPFIFVSIQPQFMPSELKEIPDSTNIVLRDEAAAYDMLTTAERARKKIAAAIKRRNLGVINVSEAAFLLARQDGAHIKTYRKLIEDAFIKTDIDFIENKLPRLTIDATARMAWLNANGMKHPGYIINDEWAFTTPKNINNWLDKIDKEGFMPRIQSSSPTPEPQAAPVEAEEIDSDMVATRQQLINAFGTHTGMNIEWFDNLNDSPKLKAARKFTGKGGRHSAEPLFCPYEVMLWLTNPKRKKGKPLNEETAWRLLKRDFSKVHNKYSIGDPNTD